MAWPSTTGVPPMGLPIGDPTAIGDKPLLLSVGLRILKDIPSMPNSSSARVILRTSKNRLTWPINPSSPFLPKKRTSCSIAPGCPSPKGILIAAVEIVQSMKPSFTKSTMIEGGRFRLHG
eukprot:CAMPEP_0169262592 /NCGR_PEP_ID=MMETSP1016-20121227/43799_1 /TAXON_ID=342587 /ORGANISM="Karlodinium micrum, Strain CCMP2283" /LENGTH=119 /DNA_ID=CAMNT_0009345147 /DNA_START=245 /DNA_END=604 /DNA_ORIENTATION=-